MASRWEPRGAQGLKEGGREAETLPRIPPAPPSHRAAVRSWRCWFLHMAVAGGWWLCLGDLRLLPPPWKGAESNAERVIIGSRAPGRPKPVPSIPGHGSEPLVGESQADAARGRSVGEGWAAVTSAGSLEEAGTVHFSGSCAGAEEEVGFPTSGSLWFSSQRPP